MNDTDLSMLDRVFRLNNYVSVKNIFREIEPSCKEMLIKCKLESNVIPCEKLFRTSLTRDGHCCSFNSKIGAE